LNKLLNNRISLIDDTVDQFRVEDVEKKLFQDLKKYLLKELDYDDNGKIKSSLKNLKVTQKAKPIRKILISDAYKAKVGKYIATFNKVRTLSDEYIKEL